MGKKKIEVAGEAPVVAKKATVMTKKIIVEPVVESGLSADEVYVLNHLSTKAIIERDHLNVSGDMVEHVIAALIEKGLVGNDGSRIWISNEGKELVKA